MTNAIHDTCLVLMLKAPRRSKRRLADQIGERAVEAAERLAACALEDLAGWPGPICMAPADETDLEWCRANSPPGAIEVLQRGSNLGERINHVDEGLRAAGCARQIIFIGIDCPELDDAYLRRSAEALERCDAVLGPAEDGGVVLMASRRPWPPLAPLPWSSRDLHAQLHSRCRAAGWNVATLEQRADIDTLNDLVAIEASLQLDRRPARQNLRRWLAGLDAESQRNA